MSVKIDRNKVQSIRTDEQRNDFILWLSSQVDTLPRSIPNMLASDWIEQNIIIVEGDYQGPYSFRLTPYLQEIADKMSIRSLFTEIGIIKANQLGFSVLSFALMCYYIYYGIGPQLFISGDATMAEEAFEKRLDPMLEASGLRHLIKPIVKKNGGARMTGDTKGVKSYKGTFMRAVGPNSEGKLRSFPSRINIVEEIDVFPSSLKNRTGQSTGNPVEKVLRRADHFGVNKRIYQNSTPKEKASSQILPIFEAGTMSRYTWVCPKCGYRQPFVWDGFQWDKDATGNPDVQMDDQGRVTKDPVYYKCRNPAGCDRHIPEHEKYKLLLTRKQCGQAEYVAQKKPDRPGLWTCQVPAFYSPTRSWLDIVLQYNRVKDDPLLYADFVNDSLAECSEQTVAKPEAHFLMRRAEKWSRDDITLPEGVIFTTLSADVHPDRIEACLVGWGKNREAWVLQYWTFWGKTIETDDQCWKDYASVCEEERTRQDGVYIGSPKVVFTDAGYNTPAVNAFCSQYPPRRNEIGGVFPVFGRDSNIVGRRPYKVMEGEIANPAIHINDQTFKQYVYHYLAKEASPRDVTFPYGYIHFPCDLGEDFYKQLTAEEVYAVKSKSGNKKGVTIENRKGRRNEALDVMKMNYAALYYICLQWFEEINKRRRQQKRKEFPIDWDKFMQMMEDANHG